MLKRKTVAVSGGVDSAVLLSQLVYIYGSDNILAAHVYHGTPQSDDMLKVVLKLTQMLSVELKVKYITNDPQRISDLGKEGYWREQRYKLLLEETIEELYTGHHIYDNTETIFMKIIRGTGINGLMGISPELLVNNKKVIRSFINMYKDELYKEAKEKNLPFIEDESNKDLIYTRNYIRQVLTSVRSRFPHIDEAFMRLSKNAQICAQLSMDLFDIDYNSMVIDDSECYVINRSKFMELKEHRRINLLLKLKEKLKTSVTNQNIKTILNLIYNSNTAEYKEFSTKNITIKTNKSVIKVYRM